MEMLSYAFMQKALIAGVIIGVLSSVVGFFVILKRLSFVGTGIAHTAFGGVAIGLVSGINPLLTAGIFALIISWFIGWVSRKGQLHEDTAIGIFFAGAMALGIGILSFAQGYYGDIFSYLFGNILAVSRGDLWLLGVTGSVVIIFIFMTFRALLFISFDEELAGASGLPVEILYYALFSAIALTVVVAVKIVGIVLASALLVIPAATGYQLAKSYYGMIAVSMVSGVLASVLGLWLSYTYGFASGATIVLCSAVMFFLAFLFSPRQRQFSFRKRKETFVSSENNH